MKKSIQSTCIMFFIFAILLSGCAPAPAPLPPTAAPSPIPPTLAPSPLPPTQPAPTDIPIPTATSFPPTPTVIPPPVLSEYLEGVEIIQIDSFDDLKDWYQWNAGSGRLMGGMFEITGQKDFNSALVFNQKIKPNHGVFLKFKTKKMSDYRSEFVFARGDWQTDNFRQFGIYNSRTPKADLIQGKNALGYNNLHGNLGLNPDTWYSFMAAVGENGEFLAVIWNPDNTTKRDVYHETIGEKWTNQDYDFQAKADIGESMFIDDFYLFSFAAIK